MLARVPLRSADILRAGGVLCSPPCPCLCIRQSPGCRGCVGGGGQTGGETVVSLHLRCVELQCRWQNPRSLRVKPVPRRRRAALLLEACLPSHTKRVYTGLISRLCDFMLVGCRRTACESQNAARLFKDKRRCPPGE